DRLGDRAGVRRPADRRTGPARADDLRSGCLAHPALPGRQAVGLRAGLVRGTSGHRRPGGLRRGPRGTCGRVRSRRAPGRCPGAGSGVGAGRPDGHGEGWSQWRVV
ncbi:MAG: hypothetical protein AVDCRST_MAG41-1061, partial [uncultured Corynebacteriales bacterium]